MVDKTYESKLNQNFDHGRYGLKPKHRATAQHATINDDLPNRIASGSIIVSKIKPSNICILNMMTLNHEESVWLPDPVKIT